MGTFDSGADRGGLIANQFFVISIIYLMLFLISHLLFIENILTIIALD